MKKIKIKETYLLFLIVIGLVSLSLYTTYALFIANTEITDVVSFSTNLTTDSSILEYEMVTVPAGETKTIELVVTNSHTSSIYYGVWYQSLTGVTDMNIGVYTEKNSTPASGTIDASSSKTILIGISNDSSSDLIINIGVVGSETSNLNLSSNRTLITDEWAPAVIVTQEYLEEHKTIVSQPMTPLEYTTPAKTEVTLNPGEYKLEVWGAQGGYRSSTYGVGGKGGYSYGTLTLTEVTNLFVYVGGQGSYVTSSGSAYYADGASNNSGGFNGGANATYYGGGGGGASDIRIGTDSLYARVIVAGGGGGAQGRNSSSYTAAGGYGGGTSGGAGSYYNGNSSTTYTGKGGTQTAGGAAGTYSSYPASAGTFGKGGVAGRYYSTSYYGSGAGGGGWYGGGGGAYRYAGGGGGSGYVYTSETATNYPSGCLLNSSYYLTNATTVAGNTSFTDFNGTTVTGHSGDGAVRISGSYNVTKYTIPRVLGLSNLTIALGNNVNLDEEISYECETGSTSCTYIGPNINDTSLLEVGEYTIYYTIKGSNGKKYSYPRNVIVTDQIEANSPKLVNGLIPVYYNESTSKWVKADSNNTSNSWYDYNQKKWANAVLVTSKNRATYQSASVGTTINDSDILAFYVWIPRYKYKVWNINKVVGTDSYDAYNTGIDIKFENGISSTGTIACNYDFTVTEGNGLSETCTGSNGDYYTHPAFTFGNDELTGFWIGKFEISSSDPSADYGGGTTTSLTTKIIPNVVSWRSNAVSNFWKVIYDMQASSNIYGLPTDRTNIDSHMLTNMEWGAVAYLTQSKYGRCIDGTCTEVGLNSNNSYTTGCGPQSQGSISSGSTCNAYNTTLGMLASTTGNIYGVYDMSGGAYEYVMGNMSSVSGNYTYDSSSAGTNYTYAGNEKYVTTYSYGTTYSNQQAYNRARLGDATGEVMLSASSSGAWYGDYSLFLRPSLPWFTRGGDRYNGSEVGLLNFSWDSGGSISYGSARAALAGFTS